MFTIEDFVAQPLNLATKEEVCINLIYVGLLAKVKEYSHFNRKGCDFNYLPLSELEQFMASTVPVNPSSCVSACYNKI